jgi:hypothetical protein
MRPESAASPPRLTAPPPRAAWLGAAALALGIGLLLAGPLQQWDNYHGFADTRAWLGIPNAADVLSNAPFLVVAGLGLWRLRRSALDWPSRHAWQLFCIALLCTTAGSAFYHWAPDNTALVFDRIPIAWACIAIIGALLAEHVHERWATLPVLAVGVALATATVAYWWFTEQRGAGDLRPYLYLQILPMLLVPMALLMKLPALHTACTPASAWWAVLGLYALAKGTEVADHAILGATGWVSGHTLKHLLAAAAAGWIVFAVTRRDTSAADLAHPHPGPLPQAGEGANPVARQLR